MNSIEKKASSVEKAIEKGLDELNITRENADIEVLQEASLFSKAKVRITYKPNASERVNEFINGLFERMCIKCQANCNTDEEENINVEITGSDSGVAIGYRGEVLDSLQYLSLIVANQNQSEFTRVTLDAENYRAKRKKTLENLANRLAQKAYRTNRRVKLEPMNPYERRIIHSALQDNEFATTESEGEEPNRHVVIIPKEHVADEKKIDFSVKRSGPPRVRSFGYKKRRF